MAKPLLASLASHQPHNPQDVSRDQFSFPERFRKSALVSADSKLTKSTTITRVDRETSDEQ